MQWEGGFISVYWTMALLWCNLRFVVGVANENEDKSGWPLSTLNGGGL